MALAEAGVRGDVREYGKIANTPAAVKALAAKLSRVGSALRFCYEAGPCGYGVQRQLTLAGHECVVVAPSLIPRKSPGRQAAFPGGREIVRGAQRVPLSPAEERGPRAHFPKQKQPAPVPVRRRRRGSSDLADRADPAFLLLGEKVAGTAG